MNSLIHFSQSPVSVAQEGRSSASKVHVSLLNHGSLSVSQWCKRSQLVSRPLYVKCTLERFSEGPRMKEENGKKKMKNSIMRGVGKASLVMTCVLGAFTLSGKMNLKPNIACAAWYQDRSRSMEKSFFKTERPSASEIKALKLWATVLSMKEDSGDVAERIISEECERFKDKPTSIPLQVVLVELLLDQGKYQKAKQKINELLADIDQKKDLKAADVPKEKIYLLKVIAVLKSESEPDINEIEALKFYAMVISKDDPKGAQEILRKKRQDCWKDGEADKNLLMALVELLVYQGEHEEAKKKIDELLEAGTKGLGKEKVYLLKAIAESGGDPKKATGLWEHYLHDELLSDSSPFDVRKK
ncbi:hypothetical protein QN277_020472 [Acacia crassicarpa]|uniref:Uncharacterized protein n=1 Tax=Acacia crassicarpa TaxID=499986 RepID=A0AAE1MNB4_9FABA|nr:hypothetical protein QN277_020472 [Acacia crassicarpa]